MYQSTGGSLQYSQDMAQYSPLHVQEDSKVTSSPEERIEVHPYTTHSVPSSPTHTLTLSSPTPMVAMSSLATTSGILTSPLVTTYTPHSTPSIPVRQASKTSQVSEATPTIPVRQVSRTNRPSEATSTIPVRQVSNDSQTSAASVVETQNGLSDSSCDSEGVMGRGREAAEEEEEEPMVSKEENRKEHTHILQSTVHQVAHTHTHSHTRTHTHTHTHTHTP